MKFDYLIVGAGLFGAVFANEATRCGKNCLVIDKRNHIGGNIFTREIEGINVHVYGAHIFHTSDKDIWEYINSFAEFNRFTNSPIARYKDELYNLPFNMNTFYGMWGVKTPQEAKKRIAHQVQKAQITAPKNLEEQGISLVGTDIYCKLIKGYTEKQWGRDACDLPPFIIKRLPVRFTYDNNYFSDLYQGVPIGGYTNIVQKMLKGSEVRLNCDYFDNKVKYDELANKIIYTGSIDKYFEYCYGELEYRSLRFQTEILNIDNYQGNAVVNYTEREIPYTRIIEHKHFEFGKQPKTVITHEYPIPWSKNQEAYYPVNDDKTNALYEKYKLKAKLQDKVVFGGRLGTYKYLDMHNVIRMALECVQKELKSQ